jgi:phosphate uptake regulator
MKRKIIQIAGSTNLVSLPKRWCIENNIKKGEEIDVIENGREIIVSTEKKTSPSSCEIDITGLDRTSIFYLLRALYKKGYDEIKVIYKNPITEYIRKKIDLNVISIIHDEVTRLPGMEIIEQKDDHCTIKAISEVNILDINILIKRIFGLMAEAFQNLIEGGEKNNFLQLESIKQKHDMIKKFISHSQRVLNKNKMIDKNNYYFLHILNQMDNLTDTLHISARFFRKYNNKIKKTTSSILFLIYRNFEIYLELFNRFDKNKIKEMSKNKAVITEKIMNLGKKIPFEEANVIIRLESNLEILRSLTESLVSKNF